MKRIVNFRPTLFAVLATVSGILFSYCVLSHDILCAALSAAAAIILFVVFIFFSSTKFKGAGKVFCAFMFIACFLAGGTGLYSAAKNYENADLGGHNLTVSGRIGEISENENYTLILLTDVQFTGAVSGKSNYNLFATVYGDNNYTLGDVLEFNAVVRDRTLIFNGNFAASALARKVKYSCEVRAADIALTGSKPDIFQKSNILIKNSLKAGLNTEEFAVAYAMLTGDSDYITEETIDAYRSVGVAHIFAVSGLHIGFLATAVYFVLSKLKFNRFFAFVVALAACVFYSGICGFSASSVRAVIMFFFLNIARLFGLKYDGISSICAAAFFILIVSPVQLFCVGFLLSFSIVGTVIILYNPLKKALKFLPDKIAAALTVSVLAEVGGIPVLLGFFGEFASLSVVVNLLFIPIAGIVFIALILCAALSLIFSPAVCLFLPNYAIFALNFLITSFDFKPFLIGGFTLGAFAAAYYGTIIVMGGLINFRKTVKTYVACVLAVICVVGTVVLNVNNAKKISLTVIGSESLSAAFITANGENLLIISDFSYRTFSQYRLNGAVKSAGDRGVSVMILKQENPVDLPATVNRLRHIMKIEKLYYCGEKDEEAESAVYSAFNRLKAENIADGDGFTFGGGKCEAALGGKCLLYAVNDGNNVTVFARLNGLGYDGLASPINTAVCYDCHNAIKRLYLPDSMISFRAEYGFSDGETHGNFHLNLG